MELFKFLGEITREDKPQSSKRFSAIYVLMALVTPVSYYLAYKVADTQPQIIKSLIDSYLIFAAAGLSLGIAKNWIDSRKNQVKNDENGQKD